MVIIDTEPWDEKPEDTPSQEPNNQLFGFQDLASDYYQVHYLAQYPALRTGILQSEPLYLIT